MFERYTSKLLLTPKTKIGEFIFDVYLSISHQSSNQITEHPVQYGVNISDHILNQPDILAFQIGMSDCSQDLVKGQFSNFGQNIKDLKEALSGAYNDYLAGWNDTAKVALKYAKNKVWNILTESRSVNAFSKLKEMQLNGTIFNCTTRLGTYKNMVIQRIEVNDDVSTKNGLLATVTCQQIFVASVEKVVVESTYQITKTTNSGIQTTKPLESVIHASGGLMNALTGGIIGQ